jgi:hypothetical protein
LSTPLFPLSTETKAGRKKPARKPPFEINGVVFKSDDWEEIMHHTMYFNDIMKLRNIEQRRAAIEFIGLDTLVHCGDFELLDKSKRGNELYVTTNAFTSNSGRSSSNYNQRLFFLKYFCPSTSRVYTSAIDPGELIDSLPPSIFLPVFEVLLRVAEGNSLDPDGSFNGDLADRAMAWKLCLTLEEYQSITEEA